MSPDRKSQTLVIVGNGMVGARLCQRLVEGGAGDRFRIVVFGEERRAAYDRVRLTELLSGRSSVSLSLLDDAWYEEHGVELFLHDPVVEIDRERRAVRSASGKTIEYDLLVFATGSRPFVPPVDGRNLPGVFVYRTVDDVYEIESYSVEAGSAAVIGGGLLGLEAAKALRDLDLDVHVIEAENRLMPRQLDEPSAAVLRDRIEGLGVRVSCGRRLARIEAIETPGGDDSRMRRLVFTEGPELTVGMVVFSAGIQPRGELAKEAGLRTTKSGAVLVDDRLQTSDRRIYAVGECASHRGTVYGLVVPGYQMADVLASNLLGDDQAFERGDVSAKLKLLGISVGVLGDHEADQATGGNAIVFSGGGVYRKLVVQGGRLVGAVGVGEWEDFDRIRELVRAPKPLGFWDLRRFRGTGHLWPTAESAPVAEWPSSAIVCGCLRVTRGEVGQAIGEGFDTIEEIGIRTKAGTMCGSCKPLVAELLGLEAPLSLGVGAPADAAPISVRGAAAMPPTRFAGPMSRRPVVPSVRFSPRETGSDDAPISAAAPAITISEVPPEPVSSAAPAITISDRPPAPVSAAGLAITISDRPPAMGVAPQVRISDRPPSMGAAAPARLSDRPPASGAAPSVRLGDRPSAPVSSRARSAPSLPPLKPISIAPPSLRSSASLPAVRVPPERGRKALLAASLAALAGTAVLSFGPAISSARALRTAALGRVLLRDNTVKQVSGYALVAVCVLSLGLSLRKRWARFQVSDVAFWRAVHGVVAALAVLLFLLHTGLLLGSKLNFVLSMDFFAAMVLGAVSGTVAAVSDRWSPVVARDRRLWTARIHLVVMWPLPLLVVLHLVAVYYF